MADPSIWDYVGPAIQTGAGVYGANAASGAAAGGYNAAAGTIQGAVNTSGAYLSPYASGGAAATGAYENLLGLGGQAPNFSAFTNSPGYQFQQQQGDQAIQRAANANGNGFSTTTLAGLANYNSGLASTQYQQYLQNLYGLTQTGANAAGNLGNQAITGASAIGNAKVGAGNANASGIAGAAGSIANLAGKLPWQQIGGYFSGGSGGSGPNTGQANSDATNTLNDYSNNFSAPSIYGSPDSSGVTTYFGDDSNP